MTQATLKPVESLVSTRGRLFVVSGPSGVGKDAVLSAFFGAENAPSRIDRCITATTRAKRVGEIPNVDYFFIARPEFEERIRKGYFLEHAVYNEEYYGTPRDYVDRQRDSGADVLLKIEVQGALQVKQAVPDAILVFLAPPSWDELERRLRGRKTDNAEEVARRLDIARREMDAAAKYDYVIVNERLAEAAGLLRAIVLAERCRVATPGATSNL